MFMFRSADIRPARVGVFPAFLSACTNTQALLSPNMMFESPVAKLVWSAGAYFAMIDVASLIPTEFAWSHWSGSGGTSRRRSRRRSSCGCASRKRRFADTLLMYVVGDQPTFVA